MSHGPLGGRASRSRVLATPLRTGAFRASGSRESLTRYPRLAFTRSASTARLSVLMQSRLVFLPPGKNPRQLGADKLEVLYRIGHPGARRRVPADQFDSVLEHRRPAVDQPVAACNDSFPHVVRYPVMVTARARLAFPANHADADQVADTTGDGRGARLQPLRQLGRGHTARIRSEQGSEHARGHPGNPGL